MFPSEPPMIWKAASAAGESGFGAHLGEPGEETNRKVGKGSVGRLLSFLSLTLGRKLICPFLSGCKGLA